VPLLLSACSGPIGLAKRDFREDLVCPVERIAARARDDLRPHQFACTPLVPYTKPRPRHPEGLSMSIGGFSRGDVDCREPDAFRDDPERNAMLVRAYREKLAAFDERYGRVYELEGCGYRRYYGCPGVYGSFCNELGEAAPDGR